MSNHRQPDRTERVPEEKPGCLGALLGRRRKRPPPRLHSDEELQDQMYELDTWEESP